MQDDVTLRSFRRNSDMPLLRQWLWKNHVSKWWGEPKEALADAKRRADGAHAIIVLNGTDVGYMCWERPATEELKEAGLLYLSETLLDVDLLLGEEAAMGRGVAPRAGLVLLDRLRAAGHGGCIGVGMSVATVRAIRAAEKIGFRCVHEFNDPESGVCRYMILDVASHACQLACSSHHKSSSPPNAFDQARAST